MASASNLQHFFTLRLITKKGCWWAQAFQAVLLLTFALRLFRMMNSSSYEKELLSCLGRLSLVVFHLMHMKTKSGPVELEPLLFEEASQPPVPALVPDKIYMLDEKTLSLRREAFNSKYGIEMNAAEYDVVKKVWTDRYNMAAAFLWHSGECDWNWYNGKALQTLQLVPFLAVYNVLCHATAFEIASIAEMFLECLCMLGTWLLLIQITLELLLVLHIEQTQLRRHLARILTGDLKTVEEIFQDHLAIKIATLSSWVHYQMPMLYAASISFAALVTCAFYVYTEGPSDSTGVYPSGYLRWGIYITVLWGMVLLAVANMNVVSDLLALQMPLVPGLPFEVKQELVRYYQTNKAYFLLLPMGIVVTPLVVLGWLLSISTMGVFSILNQVYSVAQSRVAA